MTFPVIDASRLSLFQGDMKLFENGSFKLHEGQWCEIIGPPQSGKTTLLNTFIGKHDQGNGHLQVLGYNLFPINREDARHLRRKVGYAHQFPELLMDKTIRVNLLMALQSLDKAKDKPDEHTINIILEEVGLINKLKTEIRDLSFSEIATVTILRSLIHKPRLILVDQLLEFLEYRHRNNIIAFIYNLVSKEKISLVTSAYVELPDLPFDTIKYKITEGKLQQVN